MKILFDLDSTITKEEILPNIAKKIGKEKEMRKLTEATMEGSIPFFESFTSRVNILKDIEVDKVSDLIEKTPLNEEIVKFIKNNKDICYIVTSNLDVWIRKLIQRIGLEDHCFCSKAIVKDNKIEGIENILSKESVYQHLKDDILIAVGDGSNDKGMFEKASISIAFGGVRNISPLLFEVSDYAVYTEKKLCSILNLLITNKTNTGKTIIISCAGMGNRLGMGIPKALVKIDKKTLLQRHLELLKNINDVRIVIGYKAESVIKEALKYRKDILFVFNNDYMNTGTGASVMLASKYANEYILTIDGDLIIHPDDMKKILNSKEEFIGVSETITDDPVLTIINNKKVIGFSRKNGSYEWTGISYYKTKNLDNNSGHVYQLLEKKLPQKYLIVRTKEIDTQNDLKKAKKWIKNNYEE